MNVGDVFAGAGGLALGFYLVGFSMVIAVDVNPYRRETYTSNIEVSEYIVSDVKSLDPKVFRGVDVLIAGPPCRPYSRANRLRVGEGHAEFGLEWAVVEITREVRPRVVVVEEVPSALNRLERVGVALAKAGFSYALKVINFAEYGIPQARKRGILVATRGFSAVKVFNVLYHFRSQAPTVGEAIGDLPLEPTYKEEEYINAVGWLTGRYVGRILNHECTRHKDRTIELIKKIPEGCNLRKAAILGLLPPELAKTAVKRHSYKYRRLDRHSIAPTIPHPRASMVLHPRADRILTVREVARLQAFPDWFRFKGPLDDKYRQVVDAVPPRFSYYLALSIASLLNIRIRGLLYTPRTWDSWKCIQPLQSL